MQDYRQSLIRMINEMTDVKKLKRIYELVYYLYIQSIQK